MNRFARRLIAILQIVQALLPFFFAGSAIELFAVFRYFDAATPLAYRIVQFGFYVGVCALTFVAGILLWRARPAGLKLSALSQALQVPVMTSTAFSYAVKFGIGIWISYNLETSFLGFKANLIGDTELALVFGGDRVAPLVGVNLLAVWILFHLLRALRRQPAGARSIVEPQRAPPARPLPIRVLRFVFKALLVVLSIALVPVLALWTYNCFDEAPTPSAQHWFAPMRHDVPDAENAWLYMLGMRAAENDDPIAFGRRRLAAYEARIAQRAMLPPSAEEEALKSDPLPFRRNDAQGNKVEFCDPDEADCLHGSQASAAQLAELERANAVLLRRYETLLGMNRIDALSTPSIDEPFPNAGDEAALYRALILRDLVNPATRVAALQRMVRVVEFAQRMEAPAADTVTKVLSEHTRARYVRVLDALVNESGTDGLDSLHDVIDVVLRAPAPAQREWEPALHRQALGFGATMDKTIFAGPIDAMRYCQSDCAKTWLMAQFYVPQATRNLYARLWDAVLDAHDGDPRKNSEAGARVAQIFNATMPLTDDANETTRRMLYNPVGRILVAISLPAYADFLNRQHDTEALRRMLLVKIAARKQHVAAEQMAGFLAAQPDALRDPYTGEAFAWDGNLRVIRFEPKSKKWKQPVFTLTYAADAGAIAHAPALAKKHH